MTLLSLQNISVERSGKRVLNAVDLDLAAGEFVGLIGPNGAGKTTLLRAAMGLAAHRGRSSLAAMTPDARALHCAWAPQRREVAWPVPVIDLVSLGRAPWNGRDPGGAVSQAMRRMGVADLAARPATELSGGEQARVLMARALAQDTPLLLADEPVAGLDPAAQIRLMRLFAELAASGRGVMAAVHDLGLAARYCSRLVLLSGGAVAADGPPATVLTDALIAQAFGIRGRLSNDGGVMTYQCLDVIS